MDMNDLPLGKQKNKHSMPDIHERDAPFDIAREYGEGRLDRPEFVVEGRFARFYLEQTNQESNIYFEQYQREQAEQKVKVRYYSQDPISASRFSFLWRFVSAGAFGGILLAAVFGTTWWWNEGARIPPAFTAARGAYENILSAQQSFFAFDLEQAMFLLHAARERTAQHTQGSRALLASVQGAVLSLVQGENGYASPDAAKLERNALEVAEKFVQGMDPLFQVSASSFFRTKNAYDGAPAGELIGDALVKIREASAGFRTTQNILSEIQDTDTFSEQARAYSDVLVPQLALTTAYAERLASYLKFAVWALGVERSKKFLLVAQDSIVARPTGGAIRSVGVVTTQGGAITSIVFDDVYGIDGQLQANVIPPEPIQKVATAWALHDANWFLDFPLSAKKIAYFYGKSGGGDVDGVIAINEYAVKNILAVTGPVKGDDGVLVNSENIRRCADKDVLQALSEVLPTLSGTSAGALVRVLQKGLHKKDILVWSAERDHQEMIVEEGWSGKVLHEAGADYLAVVSSDIGNDTKEVKEDIWKETNIDASGGIINTVAVQFISQEGGEGRERYMRIYVPLGSELLEASGMSAITIHPQIDYLKERFTADDDLAMTERATRADVAGVRISEESGKTVFGGWVKTGEKNTTVIVRYRLPFSFEKEESLVPRTFLFQKQPGVSAMTTFSFVVPEGMRVTDSEGNDLSTLSFKGENDIIIQAIIK